MKRKQRDSLSRWAMKLLCTLLGLILAVMLCATFAFQYFLDAVQAPQPGLGQEFSEALQSINLSSLREQNSRNLIGGRNSGLVNVLLIGQDRREGETQARSDSMILCSFHKETGKITMTSFLRDLYVPIPGLGENRINAAYSAGGMELLKKTLQENFDLYIDGCIEVDFPQFTGIIDLLGGVTLDLRQDEADIINKETGSALEAGSQTLTGEQALVYSRIRYLDSDGDFSRTNRQRKVINALVDTFRRTDLSRSIPTVSQILSMVTTDMKSGQILLLAMDLLPRLSSAEVVSQRIPADGTYSDSTVNGMAVLIADLNQAKTLLRQSLEES